MGNSSEKPILSDENKEYLNQHTEVTMEDIEQYENFLIQHPDGKITTQDFRYAILLPMNHSMTTNEKVTKC